MDEAKLFQELLVYKHTVFRICLGFSKNPWEAEDLAQDTYLKAHLKLPSLKNPDVKKEWLFRIARNTCLDHVKKNNRWSRQLFQLQPEDEPVDRTTPESLADHDEQLKLLKTTIRQLPEKQREIFILKEYAHLSYQEIAASLGIKEGTVMSRLNRARRAVIEKMRR